MGVLIDCPQPGLARLGPEVLVLGPGLDLILWAHVIHGEGLD